MSNVVVGMADCQVSRAREDILVTYALGSCIAVAIHDPVAGVGGMLHFMLPESSISPVKAGENPYMFADTGIPRLFHQAYQCGADKRRLVVRIAGGAQVMDKEGVFNIGKRNYLALKKILWKAGVLLQGEDVGGDCSRTARLEVGSGRFLLRATGLEEREMKPSVPSMKGGNQWPSAS